MMEHRVLEHFTGTEGRKCFTSFLSFQGKEVISLANCIAHGCIINLDRNGNENAFGNHRHLHMMHKALVPSFNDDESNYWPVCAP
jgi:hypothetical protein